MAQPEWVIQETQKLFEAEAEYHKDERREQKRKAAMAERGARYVAPSEAIRPGHALEALRREGFLSGEPDG